MSDDERREASVLDEDDEEEETFVDLNDPELDVREADGAPPPEDDDEDSKEEETEADGPTGIIPTEKEPIRDDSRQLLLVNEPLHSVSTAGSLFACGSENDTVVVGKYGDTSNKEAVQILSGHSDTVHHVAFSPNGKFLATASMDCTVRVWSVDQDANEPITLMHTLADLSGEVDVLLWHPSSLVLVGGAADAQAVLWNVVKGTAAMYFCAHRGTVSCASWTLDIKKLITGSGDGSVCVFNPKTGESEMSFNKDLSPEGAGVSQIACLSQDLILAGCEDGSLHALSMARGKVSAHLQEIHSQAIETIAVHHDLRLFATGSCDCLVVIWRTHDMGVRTRVDLREGITRLLWNEAMLIASCTDGDVRMWDGREPIATVTHPSVVSLCGHRQTIMDMDLCCDGTHLTTVSDDGTARVFALASATHVPLIEAKPPLNS